MRNIKIRSRYHLTLNSDLHVFCSKSTQKKKDKDTAILGFAP
jgi:hypothetical protein